MKGQHCNPAEAVEIHRDLGARQSIAMHWGTFQLTDEAREDPPRALQAALQHATISEDRFRVLDPGETVVIARSSS
jgi:L-ascorbate metabolism protein UlaG (beta-lactamase superfamily)